MSHGRAAPVAVEWQGAANNQMAPFVRNIDKDPKHPDWTGSHEAAEELPARAGDDFWAVHLLSGFQGPAGTGLFGGNIGVDCDPFIPNDDDNAAILGESSESTHACVIYRETIRDSMGLEPYEQWAVTHELGHLTGPDHSDSGVMDPRLEDGSSFTAASLAKIRAKQW